MEEKGSLSKRLERLYMDYIEIEKILKKLRDIKKQCSYRSTIAKLKPRGNGPMVVEADVRQDEEFSKATKRCMKFDLYDPFWEEVSKRFNISRNECFNRWINNVEDLDRRLSRSDMAWVKQMSEEGKDWIEMSKEMKCRPFKVFTEHLRLNTMSAPKMWTLEEDKLLEQGVEKYGLSRWRYVSKIVGTRTGKECAMRFYFLNKNVQKGKWTEDERERLMEGVRIYGEGDWRNVSTHVMTRNPIQCRSKYIGEAKTKKENK
ncbi:MYB-LIKE TRANSCRIPTION FACTOR [Encephalitozoon cuniculi GB-M1]|uniref:MYB-LIKE TRANSCRIPTION FACTOR n=2 Tax=Encephalitozoon cuniculi TaxID=6035 RepID=Q8SRP8_ENCCU|nr:Myb-like transcription factor [Encephalitozoon cuniculi GB-M1]AGE95724.1 myb-like transcription factor [Encephalitozoon cuniculi]KMV65996.1 Myb-like transcription factor [Encephalitozoon cuniculi EcunIII-L]UYI27694.1 DNA-binding protein [Encephalitozoon cuniculi]CAD25462.1 MYB-LIKE TRANSCRIPTION FACTOR [Encephalitozoon cuniculi GB-M1]